MTDHLRTLDSNADAMEKTTVTSPRQFTLRRLLLFVVGVNLACACIPLLSNNAAEGSLSREVLVRGLYLTATVCIVGALAGNIADAMMGTVIGVLIAGCSSTWLESGNSAHRELFGPLLLVTAPPAAIAALRNGFLSLFAAVVLAGAPAGSIHRVERDY